MVEELIKKGCKNMDQFNSMVQPYMLIYIWYVAVGELLTLPNINEENLNHGGEDLFEMYKLIYSKDDDYKLIYSKDDYENTTEVALISKVGPKDDEALQKKSRNRAKTNEAQGTN